MKTRQQQQGVILMIALIMLVAMTMGGIVLFRQIGTGVLIAGNLGFQQAAVAAADSGTENGLLWIGTPPGGFSTDNLPASGQPGFGYYFPAWCYTTTSGDLNGDGLADNCGTTPSLSFNPFTFDWTLAASSTFADTNGNTITYIVHRMCQTAGGINAANQQCVVAGSATSGSTKGAGGYGGQPLTNSVMPYYRITTRVVGPRGTVTFTQAIIY